MKTFILFFFLWLAGIFSLSAKDYYLNTQGNDENPGTQAQPWRTLQKVNQTPLQPGDRIFLQAGAVFEGSLILHEQSKTTARKPILISSYGNGKAIIQAGDADGIVVRNLGFVTIQHLIVTGKEVTTNQGFGIKFLNDKPNSPRLNGIKILDTEVSNFRWVGIYVGSTSLDLPGFKAPAGSRFGFKNVLIKDCIAHHNMYYGIYTSGTWRDAMKEYANENVVIQDCIAHHNLGDPDYFANHSGSGIMMDDTQEGRIEYCIAYENGAKCPCKHGGPCGIWTHASNNITIQYCESYANRTNSTVDGCGFDLDGGVTNSTIQYCYSHENEGAGILIWNYEGSPHALQNNTLRFNVLANNSRKNNYGSIHIGTSGEPVRNIDVYNNTIVTTPAEKSNPKGIWLGMYGKNYNENIRFFNNCIVTQDSVLMMEIFEGQKNIVFEGNNFHNKNNTFYFLYKGKMYKNWEDWIASDSLGTQNNTHFVLASIKEIPDETIGNSRNLPELQSFRYYPAYRLRSEKVSLKDKNIRIPKYDFWGNRITGKLNVGAWQQKGWQLKGKKLFLF